MRLHHRKSKLISKKVEKLEHVKKEMSRKKKIRFMQNLGGELIEKYGVPLLDIVYSLIEAARAAREYVGEGTIKFLLDLFTMCFNIYQSPKWSSVIVNVTQFFVHHFPTEFADMAVAWFKQAFELVLPMDDSQDFSWSKYILSFFDLSCDTLNDQIWSNISDFFGKVMVLYAAATQMISIETFDFETVCKKFSEFRENLPKVRDLIEMAFEAYRFVTGHWEEICSGNWRALLLGRDETKAFELEVRVLEQAYSFALSRQEIELANNYNMSLDDYEVRLKAAIKEAEKLILRTKSVQQRMSVSNFIRKLTEMQGAIWAQKADAPCKEEAYAIKLAGPSSCGKSSMIKLISKTILKAYGRDPNQAGSVVFTNIEEKFESAPEPHHKIIVGDDLANNKNGKPNYDRILNYINTVPRPLEKAEADKKGKYYPGNDAFIGSTNDETLRAIDCSVCPESILRRFTLDVTVNIREEFRNEYGGLKKQPQMRFDVYELTLKRFSHIDYPEDGPPTIVWKVIPREEWNTYGDDEHDLAALCAYISKDVKAHRSRQENQMKIQKELDSCGFDEATGIPAILLDDSEESSNESTVSDENQRASEILDEAFAPSDEDSVVAQVQFASPLDFWQSLSTRELWDLRALLYGGAVRSVDLYKTTKMIYRVYTDRRAYLAFLAAIGCSALFCTLLGARLAQTIATASLGFICFKLVCTRRAIDRELNRRSDQLSSLCVDIREHLETNSRKYFAVTGGVFLVYGLYRAIRPLVKRSQDKSSYLDDATRYFDQALDAPAPGLFKFQFADERDYKEGYSRLPPKDSARSKTTTSRDLQISVARALRVVVTKTRGKTYGTVNGIMVASNVIMVPAHIVPYTFPFDIETTTTPGVPNAKTKDQALTEDYCYIDREHDQAYIHLASSPSSTSYIDFFPLEYPTFYNRSTVMLWKSPGNEVKISRQAVRPTIEDLHYGGYLEHPGRFWGESHKFTLLTLQKGKALTYDTEFKGFGGLCGGVLVDADKGILYGFHVAGIPGSTRGWSTMVIQPQIRAALEKLDKTSPTLVVHSAGDIKVDRYDTPNEIVNAPPHYLREDGTKSESIVSYVGEVRKDGAPLESRARTPYLPTPFKGITENLGERRHRPPTKPNDIAKGMKTLNKLTNPVQHYEGNILEKAIEDYAQHTLPAIREDGDAAEMLRLYTQEEAMDGIGEFGLGGVPNDTSAGWPLNKSKKHFLKRDPMDESLVQVPREFNDVADVQAEIDTAMDCWSRGVRYESLYKASSKVNELLPISKALDKVRKFYGSEYAAFIASRRVLGGVARFMKKHWKRTECLVGINPLSKEWNEFHEYLTAYSKKYMIDGDFSGFDTRMAAQIMAAAAKIIVRWYREAGADEELIKLVKGALSDIVHPNIIFDGQVFKFANANPSGNLITVQLNSICNSIMMRYVYYAMMPNIKEPFAENIRLGTYGDDNAMSVKPHCKWFTHTTCQKEFEKLDIGYTAADKGAKSRPYIESTEISFLKRVFREHETLGTVVGPIEEDSILKRFHWIKKPGDSPLSPEEQFSAYTDGAFREYYLHGRAAYEKFSMRLENIVAQNPSLQGRIAFIPYDEMTKILQPYYKPDYVNTDNLKLFTESCGCDLDDLCLEA